METIKRGTSKRGATVLLQELLREAGYNLAPDGSFGPGTERALRDYQAKNGLFADGVAGHNTWMKLAVQFPEFWQKLTSKFLSEADIKSVAKDLGVEPAVVKAVREVEAGGSGFRGQRCKILFEGHEFWRQLKKGGVNPKTFQAGNENILYPKWTKAIRKYYKEDQYARLDKAKKINSDAAVSSASWGLFQIMGYHWKDLGYQSANDFVKRMEKSEGEHLKAFARFVKKNNLVKHLKNKDWAKFARGYNGPGFKKNKYDEKLARAYARHARHA